MAATDDPFATPLPEEMDPKLLTDPFADDMAKLQPAPAANETVIEKQPTQTPAPGKSDYGAPPPETAAPAEPAPNRSVSQPATQAPPPPADVMPPVERKTPTQPARQKQPQQPDPLAAFQGPRREFAAYVLKDDVNRQAWEQGTIGTRKSMLNAWIDDAVQRELSAYAKDPRIRKLPAKKKKEVLRKAYRRLKARYKRELAPMVGVLASEKPQVLDDPNGLLNRALRKKGLSAETDDIVRRFQQHIVSNERLKQKWMSESSPWHTKYINAWVEKYTTDALSAFRSSPAYKRLDKKQRKAAEKLLTRTIKSQAKLALTPIVGDYELDDPAKPDKVAASVDPAKAESKTTWGDLLQIAGGKAIEGAADTVASVADFMAWMTDDPSMRDMGWAKAARDIAQAGSQIAEKATGEATKTKLSQALQAFETGNYGSALALAMDGDVLPVLLAQSAGYMFGSGGLAGGARVAAGKALGALTTTKMAGAALRSAKAARIGTAGGIGAATGAQQGREASDRIMNMRTGELKVTPAWVMMTRKLTDSLGRPPTDQETKLALANLAAARASVHGAAVSTFATLALGGFTETMFGQLPGKAAAELFGRARTGATTATGGMLRAGGREALSEFVEEGGQQLTTNMSVRDVTGQGDVTKGAFAAGALGATVGAVTGGAIGAIQGYNAGGAQGEGGAPAGGDAAAQADETMAKAKVTSTIETDPDLAEARSEARAIDLEATRIAEKAAGRDGDAIVAEATGRPKEQAAEPVTPEEAEDFPDLTPPDLYRTVGKGRNEKQLRVIFHNPHMKLEYLYDEDAQQYYKRNMETGRTIRITERMHKEMAAARQFHRWWADDNGKPMPTDVRSVEALQVPDEAELEAAAPEPDEIVPGDEEVNTEPVPEKPAVQLGDANNAATADQVRAFVHMLVKSGEPEALALRSAARTFGSRAIPKDILQTYQDVEPMAIRDYMEQEGAPRATAQHVMRVQKALGPGLKAHVVASAADMPGMGLDTPVATFSVNGGTDTFTVVNAGAIKQPGRAKLLVMAHELARQALNRDVNETLFKAATLAAQKYDMGFTDTRGRVMDTEKVTALKNPKSKTANAIISQFQDRLMAGEETALKAVRAALNASGANIPRYMSNLQLWRALLEAGYIPETPYAKVVSAPFGSIVPPEVIPPKGAEEDVVGNAEAMKKVAGEGGGQGGGNGGGKGGGGVTDDNGNELNPVPPQVTLGGWFSKMLRLGDGMGKLTAIRSMLEDESTPAEVRTKGIEFINAMRSMRAWLNETNNLRAAAQYDLQRTIERIARETGDTVEAARKRFGEYLAALHAKERNDTLWAMLVPLRNKEAAQQRQALVDRILRGEGGQETIQEIRRVAEEGEPAVLRKDAVYGGMTDAEADSIIKAARAKGLDKIYEPAVQHVKFMAGLIRRWRKESGVYAGPAGHVVDAYNWQYYVPLQDTPESTDFDLKQEANAIGRMTRPVVAKKKAPAGGRINLEKVDVLTNLELEMRDAAFAAAVARPVKAAGAFVKAGDWTLKLGKVDEIGELKYNSGTDGVPGWEIPEATTSNPRVFGFFNDETGRWERLTMFDNDLANYLRGRHEDASFHGRKISKAEATIGSLTRLYARGYTTLRPAFLWTAWNRDLFQTSMLIGTQKGLSVAKAAKEITARTASMFNGGYFWNMYRFMAANALEREKLAQDEDFLKQPGMDRVVERWRNGGMITFADQLDPASGERFHIVPKRIKELLKKAHSEGLLERTGAERLMLTMEHISSVLDNIHRQVAYDMMRDAGAPPAEASLYSREIMDFNRFSERGRKLNTYWIFAQSGMTGINTLFTNHIWKNGTPPMRAETTPNGVRLVLDGERVIDELNKGAIGAFIISGFASTALAAMLMGQDDDGEPIAKRIQPGTWLNYHILPVNMGFMKDAGLEVPIKLPRQYGLQQIFEGLGSLLALKAMGLADGRELGFAAATHLAANLVPVGRLTFPQSLEQGGEFDLGQMVKQLVVNYTPTVAQAGAEVLLNQSTYGSNVHKTKTFGDTGANAYKDQFIGTPVIYSEITKFLNDNIGLNMYPETLETLIRDGMPILGPIFADMNRTAANLLSRPERTWLESVFGSSLTPLPGVAYDVKYDWIRKENAIQVQYINPARAAYQMARSLKGAERAKAMRKFNRDYPWFRPILSVRGKYSKRLKTLREDVIELRRQGRFAEAEMKWRDYNALKRKRLGATMDVLKAHGVTDF